MADDFDLGLGGLGDLLKQQLADDEDERRKKMAQERAAAGPNKGAENALGLAAINLLGGFPGSATGATRSAYGRGMAGRRGG